MGIKRYGYLLLGFLFMLTSCDLLGIGGDDGDDKPDETFSLAWQQRLPSTGGSAGPLIGDGSVFLLGFTLSRLDLQTGETIWQSPLGSNPPFTVNTENGNLLLADESVIVSLNETVLSFARTDGQSLWETTVSLPAGKNDPLVAAALLPLAQTSSRIFVGGQNVIGLNKSTGAAELDITLDTLAPEGVAQQITALATAGSDVPLLFAATQHDTDTRFLSRGNLTAINTGNGEAIWTTGITDIVSDSTVSVEIIASDLAIAGGLLVVLSTTEVVGLEPNTGDIIWQTSLNGEAATLGQSYILVEGNAIFVNTFEGSALRLNAANGTVVWQTEVGGDSSGLGTGRLALDDGQLYYPLFGFSGSGIRVIDAGDGTIEQVITGANVENVNFDFDFFGGIAVSNQILVRQGATNAYGIELSN